MKIKIGQNITIDQTTMDGEIVVHSYLITGQANKVRTTLNISSKSAKKLVVELKKYLRTWRSQPIKAGPDLIDISGGGTDIKPSINIYLEHKNADDEIQKYSIYIPEGVGQKFLDGLGTSYKRKYLTLSK